MSDHDADLVAYYDNEVRARAHRELTFERVSGRAEFLDLLAHEGRRSIVEVGAGGGRDGRAFVSAGLDYHGVDLSPGSVETCRSFGLDVQVASALDLPFDDATFDAGWTMSTLLHVDDLDTALSELVRVVRPSAPLAIGIWGAESDRAELVDENNGYGPPRYFTLRSDSTLRAALARHGTIETWRTHPGDPVHYQWAVLRAHPQPHLRAPGTDH